jgi:anti-sigma regulatory factor (Ser/Thr protein kinase)
MQSRGVCGTCGGLDRREFLADAQADRALLDRLGAALAARGALASRTAMERDSTTAELRARALLVRRRLRMQRSLLRSVSSQRHDLQASVAQALASMDRLLHETTGGNPSTEVPVIDVQLPRDRSCAMVARRLLEGQLAGTLEQGALDDALLVASELANNAFLHGRGRITFRVTMRAQRLRIEVCDEGRPEWIGIGGPIGGRGGGSGLRLVSHLAAAWGAEISPARVWAELPVDDSEEGGDR